MATDVRHLAVYLTENLNAVPAIVGYFGGLGTDGNSCVVYENDDDALLFNVPTVHAFSEPYRRRD